MGACIRYCVCGGKGGVLRVLCVLCVHVCMLVCAQASASQCDFLRCSCTCGFACACVCLCVCLFVCACLCVCAHLHVGE